MPLNTGPSFGRSSPVPIPRPNPGGGGMNRGYQPNMPMPQRPGMGAPIQRPMPPGPGQMPNFGRGPMGPPMGHPAPPPQIGGGMVRPPSMMQPPPPMSPGMGGGVMPQPGFNIHSPMMGGNTGVTGGMMGRPMPQPMPQPGGMQQGGGLWNAYNNLSNQQGGPPRPPMGY